MVETRVPGIYIEEEATGPRPIQAVGTSTVGFVGEAPDPKAFLNQAVDINNWSEFQRKFANVDNPVSTPLSTAVYGFYQNAQGRCYIVNIGKEKTISSETGSRKGLALLKEIDDVAIVAAPGFTDPIHYNMLLEHCELLKDRFAILDAPPNVNSVGDLINGPAVVAKPDSKKDKDKPASDAAPVDPGKGPLIPRQSDKGFGAFYFPWIKVQDPFNPNGDLVAAPPSGHIAGVYARVDAERGVHKAPANEIIRGALGLTYPVTREEQADLNDKCVNCIRPFPLQGIRIWGARTLAGAASEWRYINVRRLFNMIEESIEESMRWVVFEPNDRPLWKSIKRDIGAFLTTLWRGGMLKGATPQEAFFVKCDEETNPPEIIDQGKVVTVIGIAPVKPAEFVIFKLGQSIAGTEVEVK
jgi:phage tail sheath protein FI